MLQSRKAEKHRTTTTQRFGNSSHHATLSSSLDTMTSFSAPLNFTESRTSVDRSYGSDFTPGFRALTRKTYFFPWRSRGNRNPCASSVPGLSSEGKHLFLRKEDSGRVRCGWKCGEKEQRNSIAFMAMASTEPYAPPGLASVKLFLPCSRNNC